MIIFAYEDEEGTNMDKKNDQGMLDNKKRYFRVLHQIMYFSDDTIAANAVKSGYYATSKFYR